MSNDIEGIIKTTLENINSITENERLISSKITYDNSSFLAISKLNINFIIGGSDLDKTYKRIDVKPFAGAAYVNLSLSPQLLLYESDNQIHSISVEGEIESSGMSGVLGNIFSYIKELKNRKKEEKEDINE